jgi:hypothetical protein
MPKIHLYPMLENANWVLCNANAGEYDAMRFPQEEPAHRHNLRADCAQI